MDLSDALGSTRVLVTAGPTFEPIDPVRFIGNRSSGKMGYAIAEEARERGASVVLIAGPTALPDPTGMEIVRIETTAELRAAVLNRVGGMDVVVMAAAVADFHPALYAETKLKRRGAVTLELVPNPDIAVEVSAAAPSVVHVGFALETESLLDAARSKLRRKGQHLVVANQLSSGHNPFGAETNRVAFVWEDRVVELAEMSKRDVARHLWDEVAYLLRMRSPREE